MGRGKVDAKEQRGEEEAEEEVRGLREEVQKEITNEGGCKKGKVAEGKVTPGVWVCFLRKGCGGRRRDWPLSAHN